MQDMIDYVDFDLFNYQGRFRVSYDIHQLVEVHAYGRPEEDGETFEPYRRKDSDEKFEEVLTSSGLVYESHDLDLPCLLASKTLSEVVEACRHDFLNNHISRSVIEPPDLHDMPRIDFRVRMGSGMIKRVILLANGRGYLLGKEKWLQQGDMDYTAYVAPCPTFWFDHPFTPSQLCLDAADMAHGGERAVRMNARYEAYFWSDLNPRFAGRRWIRDQAEIADQPLTVTTCTLHDLKSLLSDAVRLDDDIWERAQGTIGLRSFTSTDGTEQPRALKKALSAASFSFSDEVLKLADTILIWAQLSGFYYEHNGLGFKDNWSSYTKRKLSLNVKVVKPTASERMEAIERLVSWGETTGVDVEPYIPG